MSTPSGHSPRSVVVVGASSEIGQAIARRFLDDGDTVVGISHAALADAPFQHLVADCSDPSAATTAVLEETLHCQDRSAAFDMLQTKFSAVGEFMHMP